MSFRGCATAWRPSMAFSSRRVACPEGRQGEVDHQIVINAVRTLRADGQRVSIRAVHGITGGSFRDLSRLLKELLADDEIADLEAETTELAPTPSVGRLVEAYRAIQAAEQKAGEAQRVLNETRDRLRDALGTRPFPATDPSVVADSVAARVVHEAIVVQLREEVAQLERIVQAHMSDARTCRREWESLQARAQQLRDSVLPRVRRDAAEARQRLGRLERDLHHQLEMARSQVQSMERAIVVAEAEWRALTGGSAR
jgi:hypothetical protein